MTRPARVVINLSALRHNFQQVRQLAPDSKIISIVKADAYGHGLTRIASALEHTDAFGVACLEEARELRTIDIMKPIILLEGPYSSGELEEIARLNLDIVIHDLSQLRMLEHAPADAEFNVWLKIDTGMHRLGFLPDEVIETWRWLSQLKCIRLIRIMTHLANASERNHPMTRIQLDCFATLHDQMQLEASIANSAGIIAHPDSHADWVRPGLMLYGVSPMSDSTSVEENLQPVMTMESRLIAVKNIKQGDTVGYGATWTCPEDMPVGIVATGYGDGYPRHAPSGTPVLVNQQRTGLIGRASMDMLIVDLRTQSEAKVGDRVILWGDGLPVEEVAKHADTIPYELLSSVHKRLDFVEHGQG